MQRRIILAAAFGLTVFAPFGTSALTVPGGTLAAPSDLVLAQGRGAKDEEEGTKKGKGERPEREQGKQKAERAPAAAKSETKSETKERQPERPQEAEKSRRDAPPDRGAEKAKQDADAARREREEAGRKGKQESDAKADAEQKARAKSAAEQKAKEDADRSRSQAKPKSDDAKAAQERGKQEPSQTDERSRQKDERLSRDKDKDRGKDERFSRDKDRDRDDDRDRARRRDAEKTSRDELSRTRIEEGRRVTIDGGSRTIERRGDRVVIRGNDFDRFGRRDNRRVKRLPNGRERVIIVYPDGSQIITITGPRGEIYYRARRDRGGREIVLIREVTRPPLARIDLGPLQLRIPREQYIVASRGASRRDLQIALSAPPVEAVERVYSLEEVRSFDRIRDKMRRIDINDITFETDSAIITEDQAATLEELAAIISELIDKNPGETFLIEGHTDAVGSDVYNLALSDRRAEAVAIALSDYFDVPPENLVTQGYGESFLKIVTEEPERENRRVAVRRITPLISEVSN